MIKYVDNKLQSTEKLLTRLRNRLTQHPFSKLLRNLCPWHFFFFFKYLFIYLFMAVLGLRFCARAFSSCGKWGPLFIAVRGPLLLRSTGSRRTGSVIVAHGPSCSAARGIFPDQGSNPCPLHWQADSQPLRHQGSPVSMALWCLSYKFAISNQYSSVYPKQDLWSHFHQVSKRIKIDFDNFLIHENTLKNNIKSRRFIL